MKFQRKVLALVVVVGTLSVQGCGPAGPRTYPVRGQVELVSGDIAALAGSTVEAALATDTSVRASGVIHPDGRFTLETLHAGVILRGAREGNYVARIIPADDDPAIQRRALKVIPPRFRRFDTSDLSFSVPAAAEVIFRVSAR